MNTSPLCQRTCLSGMELDINQDTKFERKLKYRSSTLRSEKVKSDCMCNITSTQSKYGDEPNCQDIFNLY